MSDLIERQKAIDAPFKKYDMSTGVTWIPLEYVEQLPSAHPVITCDGCRFVGTYDTDPPCRCCIRREKDYYEKE